MKQKPRLRIRLTLCVGAILLISNTLLVLLLLYNFSTALMGFLIPIDGEMVECHFDDGMEAKLLTVGIVIAVVATGMGTLLTYILLGKVLRPLQELSDHMQRVDQENLLSPAGISSNVREVDSLIDSFNSMSAKIQKLFENQRHVSSFVAHEFRTPLAVIQTAIDVYKKQPDQEPDKLISQVSEQIAKLSMLVTQILNLSSIQRIELKERVPICLLLDEAMEDLEDFAQENQVTLELRAPIVNWGADEQTLQVIGNHDLLYQAFFNLLENGIKYNRAGGSVTVEIGGGNGKICVRISDTGCGIPAAEREKIYCPFYRCEHKSSRKIQGNGIGLAFAKQVFEHHKGSLSLLESRDGSCFQVCLNEYVPAGRITDAAADC